MRAASRAANLFGSTPEEEQDEPKEGRVGRGPAHPAGAGACSRRPRRPWASATTRRREDHFDALIAVLPDERDLLERARAYRALCERALCEAKRPPSSPRASRAAEPRRLPPQPRRVRGGAEAPAPGRGDPSAERARALLPGRHLGPRGDTAAALKALRSAIAASPANRAQARGDSDFDAAPRGRGVHRARLPRRRPDARGPTLRGAAAAPRAAC